MRKVRPAGAPPSWAADELRVHMMGRQGIRVEHEAAITEGELDHVDGMDVHVFDDEGQPQVITSSAILAFEIIDLPIDHSDELRG
jgi:hypothetical protein